MCDINTKNKNNTIEILISKYHKSFEYFSLSKFKECQECCDYIDKHKCNHNYNFVDCKKDCIFCRFKYELEKINT